MMANAINFIAYRVTCSCQDLNPNNAEILNSISIVHNNMLYDICFFYNRLRWDLFILIL
jgi:hypothetical protein